MAQDRYGTLRPSNVPRRATSAPARSGTPTLTIALPSPSILEHDEEAPLESRKNLTLSWPELLGSGRQRRAVRAELADMRPTVSWSCTIPCGSSRYPDIEETESFVGESMVLLVARHFRSVVCIR